MNFTFQSSQIVGLSDDRHWSQTFVQDNLLIVLELVSDGSFSAMKEGNKFLNGLTELLKRRQPQDKIAFKLLVSQYINSSLIQNRISSLVVGMVIGENIYLFCRRDGKVLLKRGSLWSEIISGEGFATGILQVNDILILLTQTFQKFLSAEKVIEKFEREENFTLAGEKLGSFIQNFDESKGAAGVFTLLDNKNEEAANFEERTYLDNEVTKEPAENVSPVSFQQVIKIDDPTLTKIGITKTDSGPESFKSRSLKNFIFRDKIKSLSLPHYPKEILLEVVSTPKKQVLLAALMLTLLLATSIFFGLGKDQNTVFKKDKNNLLFESITHKIEEGEVLIDLNSLRAKSILTEVKEELLEVRDKSKKGSKERIQAEELLKRTEFALGSVLRSYQINNPAVFLDLTLVKEGASALYFAVYDKKLAVLDIKNPSVILVNTDNLASSIMGGGSKTPNPRLIGLHGNNIFILTEDGLVKIDAVSQKQELIVKNLSQLGEAAKLVGYAGNVYILDSLNKKIWKFMALENGYSQGSPYLAPDETIGFEKPVSFAIDGSVWVLGDNRVKKYSRGAEEYINLEGLDKPLKDARVIFTDDESKFFYILDKGENRVVVFNKDGIYNSEYNWPGIQQVSDMVVIERTKKILLLAGSQIYSIDLKL